MVHARGRSEGPQKTWRRNEAVIAGRYRLRTILGRGGYSVVFEADDLRTGRAVALKVLQPAYASDPGLTRRFLHEARVTAGLRHPNTIRVLDFGKDDEGVLYMAMELLHGCNLKDELSKRVRSSNVFTESEAIAIGVSVTSSLVEAHAHHLVHRDLKPSNVFLHDLGREECIVKVLDFGIAKIDGAELTHAKYPIGTASFMSPEQVCEQPVDARTDIYCLGLILFSLVSGRLPFYGKAPLDVMLRQVAHPLPDLERVAKSHLSPVFRSIVRRATAKLPKERFPNAKEMRLALLECGTSTATMDAVPEGPFRRAT
jgi:eukaryotic-like serine/threonine-protein kinase